MTDGLPDYGAIADSYERLAEPLTAPFAHRAVDLARLPPGASVIDVAAGTGALALAAAQAGARVLATDIAPAMVSRAAVRLQPFADCAARAMGCDALDCADATYDSAFSIFGLMLLPIWRAGLAELARVTKAGGTITVSAWPDREGSRPMLVLKGAFATVFPGREFWPGAALNAWSEASLTQALEEAGCTAVAVHRVECPYIRPSVETLLQGSTPFFRLVPGVGALDEAEFASLRPALADAFAAFARTDGSVRLPVEALIAVGQRR